MPTLASWSQSFGSEAERYDRARPPYPAELVDRIVHASPGPDVLDVGCGTGIAARQLQAAGRTVLGVEPDDRMAAFARHTGVTVETSAFETWDPAGRTFDTLVAAQSWHWVDAATGPRRAALVLRPGGLFVALWHVFAVPDPVSQAFADAFRRVAPDAPFQLPASPAQAVASYEAGCARTAEALLATGAFTGPDRWAADWEHTYTTAGYLDFMRTTGSLTALPPDAVDVVVDSVGTAVDAMGGGFTTRHRTLAVAVVRG
ncbi:bifunctional 2-polyprenyl-6-hydroxyphenol methylase/3-demethylubiquinol 3-O-methyltransferase UbiG [Nocardia sp. NRRL S-836]|uniref:class I SAM-dependent methyltransferase n=1 Tax=Nocardia sp. NRRL S-836 TaxID=1519492 RepID=UPI0006ADA397|nr:class I SAM-dependent methyltransferase [Nocardia sp. NRRL S-836]KOV79138.1 methyltransferase type 11 [Nocardia sp. NRRL S-836]